jgi:hypothetical protein
MKLILQAIKSLLNKINSRLEALENKTSDENIADGKFLPEGTPFAALLPRSVSDTMTIHTSNGTDFFSLGNKAASELTLKVGMIYTVHYNGTDYDCECKSGTYKEEPGRYLGNGEIVGGEISSEPFTLFLHDTYQAYDQCIVIPAGGSTAGIDHEISITGDMEYLRKMDARLMPDGTRTLVIEASIAGSVVTIESGHMFRDVLWACSEEKKDAIIRCECDGDIRVYRLSRFDGTTLYFTCLYLVGTYVRQGAIEWTYIGEIHNHDAIIKST